MENITYFLEELNYVGKTKATRNPKMCARIYAYTYAHSSHAYAARVLETM